MAAPPSRRLPPTLRPRSPLALRDLPYSLENELLQALPFVRFRRVDIPAGVGRDAVNREELSRIATAGSERCQLLQRQAVENVNLLVLRVRQVQVPLLRISRKFDI